MGAVELVCRTSDDVVTARAAALGLVSVPTPEQTARTEGWIAVSRDIAERVDVTF
ncbi:hypothetical protein [Acrocarpospora corrugata]|uniref:hypothetical protein n=1 Tax=Acrocarpospora corrugata TaxID=35763 RepID=UPI0012D31127|nr:hypothetical protein [Acrocarpospora corrugata]